MGNNESIITQYASEPAQLADDHAALESLRKLLKPIFFPNLEDSLRAVLPLLLPDAAARRHQVEHDAS